MEGKNKEAIERELRAIPKRELLLIDALLGVIMQYMPEEKTSLDADENANEYKHACMKAGEDAVEELERYGVAHDDGWSIVLDLKKVDIIADIANELRYK